MDYNKLNKQELIELKKEIYSRKKHQGNFCWFGLQINNGYELSAIEKANFYLTLDEMELEKELNDLMFDYIEKREVEDINRNRRGFYNPGVSKKHIFNILFEEFNKIFLKYTNVEEEKTIEYLSIIKEIPKFKIFGIEFFTHKIKNISEFDSDKKYTFFQDGTVLNYSNLEDFLEKRIVYVESGDYTDYNGDDYYIICCCKNIDLIKDSEKIEELEQEAYSDEYDFDFEEFYRSCDNCKNNKNCKYREKMYNSLEKSIPTKQNLLDYYLKNEKESILKTANEKEYDFKKVMIKNNLMYKNYFVKILNYRYEYEI